MAPDSRSKWRKTGGLKGPSGYHASNLLTVPMLGRIPVRTRVTPINPHSCRKIGLRDNEPGSTRLGILGRAPDTYRQINQIHDIS